MHLFVELYWLQSMSVLVELDADLEKRPQGFENKCYRQMLYHKHETNYVIQQVSVLAERLEFFLSTVWLCKLL